jgi:hypothetical protein
MGKGPRWGDGENDYENKERERWGGVWRIFLLLLSLTLSSGFGEDGEAVELWWTDWEKD